MTQSTSTITFKRNCASKKLMKWMNDNFVMCEVEKTGNIFNDNFPDGKTITVYKVKDPVSKFVPAIKLELYDGHMWDYLLTMHITVDAITGEFLCATIDHRIYSLLEEGEDFVRYIMDFLSYHNTVKEAKSFSFGNANVGKIIQDDEYREYSFAEFNDYLDELRKLFTWSGEILEEAHRAYNDIKTHALAEFRKIGNKIKIMQEGTKTWTQKTY